ncbi:MAG: methyltransferase domain-containing protein [Nitrospirota bacterium]
MVSTLQRRVNTSLRKYDLPEILAAVASVRIIVGASEDRYDGWIATDKTVLDLLQEADWAYYFTSNPIDAILAEHVWEHLDCEGAIIAAQNCFTHLKPGGYIRVAVPDGLHPDEDYIDRVRPGGSGLGSDDHHVLYTYRTLQTVFESVGFQVTLLEYFDERGTFHEEEWSPADGMITRSARFDSRNFAGDLRYTSIILDARKAESSERTSEQQVAGDQDDGWRMSSKIEWPSSRGRQAIREWSTALLRGFSSLV